MSLLQKVIKLVKMRAREFTIAGILATTAVTEATADQDPYADIGDITALKSMIKQHEGNRLQVYKDTLGLDTIGYGHLVKPGEDYSAGITQQQADELFDKDFDHHYQAATKTPGWSLASPKQRRAMVDLTYNMGPSWHKKFPKFSAAAAKGDWREAANQLRDSRWYKQVKSRGQTITRMIGEPQGDKSAGL